MRQKPSIAIVGAGIIGRLIALRLSEAGCEIGVFEKLSAEDASSSSYKAAGMLAPFCELAGVPRQIMEWGCKSIEIWREIETALPIPSGFSANGTIIAAHEGDQNELARIIDMWRMLGLQECFENIDRKTMAHLEPELTGSFDSAIFISREGHINPNAVMAGLAKKSADLGVTFHFDQLIAKIEPRHLTVGSQTMNFDWIIDCRGLGSRPDLEDLRGVRGELFLVHAPEISISRPVRIIHPRYPLYIVPRGQNKYVVGASVIESENKGPPTVRSALELLSALYAVSAGFGEAQIIESHAQLRPAFEDNLPRIRAMPGLMQINGLYRHGYLLSPYLAKGVAKFIMDNSVLPDLVPIWHEFNKEKM